jgi:hypothetical protein
MSKRQDFLRGQKDQTLWINESYTIYPDGTDDRAYRSDDTGFYKTYFHDGYSLRRIFKTLQREHGRCMGHMYLGSPNGRAAKVGYVFRKRLEYEDDPDRTYLLETWVHFDWRDDEDDD